MPVYKRFVVAVDGSRNSARALEHAVNLSKQCQGTLLIVHVVPFLPLAIPLMERLSVEGEKLVSRNEARARALGARVKAKLLEGDPAQEIIHAAETEKCDAIVMGTRGLGPLRGLLLGSVSSKVAQTARCTVILVP